MPAGQGKDAERFAAAVEHGAPPGLPADDGLARDLEIVAMLRSRGAAFAPEPDAKARAKQRLMAALAAEQGGRPGGGPRPPAASPSAQERTAPLGRILEPSFPKAPGSDAASVTARMSPVTERLERVSAPEPETEAAPAASPARRPGRRARHSLPNRPAGRAPGTTRPTVGSLRRRVAIVSSAALVMMLALTGGGFFASQDALPGENLYALKRAAESAGLAFTFDEPGKARRHLEIASTRIDEMERLVGRGSQTTAADPAVYSSSIREFDAATGEGSRMLLASPEAGSAAAVDDLHTWAAEQSDRLTTLQPDLPASTGADGSIAMLDRLVGRTEALDARASCSEVTSGAVDDLGPLPAEGICDPRAADDENRTSPESEAPGGSEDTTGPTEDPGSSATTDTDDPSSTPNDTTEPTEDSPGLLPDLDREGIPLDGSPLDSSKEEEGERDEGSTTTTEPGGTDEGNVAVPLPLLPPITLPPLLPGLPGITLG